MGVGMGDQRLSTAFIDLTDTLGDQFDAARYLGRLADHCVRLLDAAAASVALGDEHGRLRTVASAPADSLTRFGEQPGTDDPAEVAYRSGGPVTCTGLDAPDPAPGSFAADARAEGFTSVRAWPLRHRAEVIGSLTLYRSGPGPGTGADDQVAGALTRVATISLLRERRQERADTLAGQLQHALDSRLVIEQAKGILSERGRFGVDQAFALLRGHARHHQMRLALLAHQVIDGTVDPSVVINGVRPVEAGRSGARTQVPNRHGGPVPPRARRGGAVTGTATARMRRTAP